MFYFITWQDTFLSFCFPVVAVFYILATTKLTYRVWPLTNYMECRVWLRLLSSWEKKQTCLYFQRFSSEHELLKILFCSSLHVKLHIHFCTRQTPGQTQSLAVDFATLVALFFFLPIGSLHTMQTGKCRVLASSLWRINCFYIISFSRVYE